MNPDQTGSCQSSSVPTTAENLLASRNHYAEALTKANHRITLLEELLRVCRKVKPLEFSVGLSGKVFSATPLEGFTFITDKMQNQWRCVSNTSWGHTEFVPAESADDTEVQCNKYWFKILTLLALEPVKIPE